MTAARLDNVRKLLEAEQAYLDGLHAQALSRRLLYVSDESLSWAQLDVAAALVECSAEQIRRAYPR